MTTLGNSPGSPASREVTSPAQRTGGCASSHLGEEPSHTTPPRTKVREQLINRVSAMSLCSFFNPASPSGRHPPHRLKFLYPLLVFFSLFPPVPISDSLLIPSLHFISSALHFPRLFLPITTCRNLMRFPP
ncbi:hypothetical protein ACRALDRAFT_206637 [Sodiomyces alcalophilus JCM 7366]|uniref:uncharacterized protein n=1 Tax=Sodiomyces alcalophilus JCM 7366 TaxID=591952 RepID=UPI0039B5D087